jgi:hypothetical protein
MVVVFRLIILLFLVLQKLADTMMADASPFDAANRNALKSKRRHSLAESRGSESKERASLWKKGCLSVYHTSRYDTLKQRSFARRFAVCTVPNAPRHSSHSQLKQQTTKHLLFVVQSRKRKVRAMVGLDYRSKLRIGTNINNFKDAIGGEKSIEDCFGQSNKTALRFESPMHRKKPVQCLFFYIYIFQSAHGIVLPFYKNS